jgi:hypothetical protein
MEIDPNETGMVEGDGNHVYPNAEIRAPKAIKGQTEVRHHHPEGSRITGAA